MVMHRDKMYGQQPGGTLQAHGPVLAHLRSGTVQARPLHATHMHDAQAKTGSGRQARLEKPGVLPVQLPGLQSIAEDGSFFWEESAPTARAAPQRAGPRNGRMPRQCATTIVSSDVGRTTLQA